MRELRRLLEDDRPNPLDPYRPSCQAKAKRKTALADEERKLLDGFLERVPEGLRMTRIAAFTDIDPAYKITMSFDYASAADPIVEETPERSKRNGKGN